MRIALFSDIHANLPAFEAFLTDLDSRKVDAVYCLGDMIGYNIWPNEIIAEIRRRGIATLAGNHDQKTKGYAYELVSAENRQYLTMLPAHIKLEFQLNNDHLNIVLAHGSTRSINEYVLEDTDETYVLAMMNEAEADILCVGHSHLPYHRIIDDNGSFKHVINIGSVGKPKDGNPNCCYVLLTINESSSVNDRDGIHVDSIRVPYNVERAAKAVEDSPLPDELADRLRKAY
ncbi:metallophosphoesterase family protein [Mucilaginibacter rubeus]|jgi:putative phosphoesterase|uniref:Metallophosphoesterase family protein n=1 Tax=Mucilaginibacter rubeus TaxID=2027860 RepID=A0AAE6JM13_9SPHI|nr:MULTISPECIES: metallophosphoesterase family protein [Mucilaginibacter]NHA05662.1 metallophosphoesterase family protein [Mucilaginibacter inviolabilis]QEM07022.1 metallophosphoesterase family protein [Mucilaginibacter rubeus]QTE35466.1 metallophosphoesterase family protein [Mucilaginibacter gossypii]QTE43834.1 metallophosphoesterase family protein [Mucilaginibacter rubeus]QTE50435.1 metallophosphoesterase family protein [Mucilaginibacter rubeus]